jgi:MFS family permease
MRSDSVRMATTTPPPAAEPAPAAESGKIRFRALVRASGGPRYAVAIGVDAVGTGMLRPFLLLYGIDVLRLAPPVAGLAMTAGAVAGLAGTPLMGRWLERGVRSAAVAAAMFVRVIGTALLLVAPAGTSATVWVFVLASVVFGVGNQTSSPPARRSPATTSPWPSAATPAAAALPSDVVAPATSSAHRESSRLTESFALTA